MLQIIFELMFNFLSLVDTLQKEMEAAERLAPDIADDEDDHLDISLEEETTFLNEYLTLMKHLNI